MATGLASRIALAALAAALLVLLAFLFARSSAVDIRREVDAAAVLRELRSLDARLDLEAVRLAADMVPAAPLAERMRAQSERLLAGLHRAQAAALREAIGRKAGDTAALEAAHARSLEALASADESLSALGRAAREARAVPRSADRAGAVSALAEAARSQLRGGAIAGFPAAAEASRRTLRALREAGAFDPRLAALAQGAEEAASTFLQARAAELAALQKVAFHTAGARVDLTSQTLLGSVEAALADQERWRIYLAFYAGALLVAVGWLASRVLASQAALREANTGLERRVAERTRELSEALTKLKESEAQLVQTEKMSSLGQMVAGVAHEINTPLAYVKNSVATVRDRIPELRDAVAQSSRLRALMREEAPDPNDMQETFRLLSARLDRIESDRVMEDLDALTHDGLHGIGQISELVMNLKNFSRLDRSRVSTFDVNEGVTATLLIAKAQLGGIRVDKKLTKVPPIECSPSQVNQVLLNIVTNAAQAMDKPGGRILVVTRPVADGVAVEIADNGKGIPPDVLPRIFDPFFTTKEVGKGTGLGLSIAYKIVSQHGGRIDVRSKPGHGTIFTIVLPLHPPAEVAAALEASAA